MKTMSFRAPVAFSVGASGAASLRLLRRQTLACHLKECPCLGVLRRQHTRCDEGVDFGLLHLPGWVNVWSNVWVHGQRLCNGRPQRP